jgi:Tol biopolymer transport system component
MLTKSGVKLLDFGLAKAIAPAATPSSLTSLPTQQGLTQEGTILGTFQYMAPEQLEGKETDARTDIFALGAVLYEMATGRKAFSRTSQASLISAIMKEEPTPISQVQPMAPPALDRVVRRCLAKDPDRRWQSARDVALELEEVPEKGEAPSVEAARARPRGRGAAGWIAAALLLALVGVVVLERRSRVSAPAAKLRFALPPPTGASIQGMLALSPDGRSLAFVATTPDGRDLLFLRPLDALEARPLDGTEEAAYPFWSPDGRRLAFFARGKLKRIDPSGGPPQLLCDAASPRGGSWGSRGTIVFSVNAGGEIHRVPEGGGQPANLSHLATRPGQTHRWPSFLPDGRHFLYFVLGVDSGGPGIHVASLDSSETKRLVSADAGAIYTPPGFLLYLSGERLLGRRFDADRLLLTGEAFPVLDDLRWDSLATGRTALTASNTGLLACQTGGVETSRLLWYDRSGRQLKAIGPDGAFFEPALSPDGRWLVVSRISPEKFASNIWTIDLERETLARLTSKSPIAATPLWSPDGRRIAYGSYGTSEVLIQNARGSEEEKVLFRTPAFTPLDDWSPDGRYLFYETMDFRRLHVDVWVRDLQTGVSRPLLQAAFNQMGARLSPDGRWLAYESEESGVFEIFVRSFPEPGERLQVSKGGGQQARWRGDGRELFYVSPDRKLMSVEIGAKPAFEAAAPRALFQTKILPLVEARNHYDVTRDGQRFVVNSRRPEDASLPITILSGWMPEKSD